MRISLNWLSDYVDIKKIPAEEIARLLTDVGLEVEAIEKIAALKGDVIIGEILHAEKHPDADTLRVCKVHVGQTEPLDIVCGAPNARAGIKVCVALVGSTLPKDFKIKKSKIRGVTSNGMLCAEDELGVGNGHDGIIEVDAAVAVGTSVAEMYGLIDTVLTLGITPNRGDCLGYIGVARELSAKLGIPMRYPSYQSVKTSASFNTTDQLNVTVENPEDCARFTALAVQGLKTTPSPSWMQRRLEAAGMRPINNIVDVTNYVMLEYSQPIHAYDQRDLTHQRIDVRTARTGETLTTLDNQVRNLTTQDILICDGPQPIGLAGVMGGLNSEVKDDTSSIIIEVANFDPRKIRKTSKRVGLHTEASHRFERSCDASVCDKVAWRVGQLLQQIAQEQNTELPQVAADLIDLYGGKIEAAKIALRIPRARQILGLTVLTASRVMEKLEPLGLMMLDQTPDKERLLFQVPAWRKDLASEIDLIEEVGRMIGYDEVPFRLPQMEIGSTPENPVVDFIDQSKRVMAHIGATEVITFPFMGEDHLKKFLIPDRHTLTRTVFLANPLAEQENRMRSSILMTLLPTLASNRRHGVRGARLFESGRVFFHPDERPSSQGPYTSALMTQGHHISSRAAGDRRSIERHALCLIIDQPFQDKIWNSERRYADFYNVKDYFQKFVGTFGRFTLSFDPVDRTDIPYAHPAAAAYGYVNGKCAAVMGELHPEVAQSYDFDPEHPPVFLEVDLETLFEATRTQPKVDTLERKFPPVRLDLAFIVDETLSYARFEQAIEKFQGKRNLKSASLFDVYQGSNLPAGKKSMAFSLSFQSPKRTLSDKEVEQEVEALKDWLKRDLAAELR